MPVQSVLVPILFKSHQGQLKRLPVQVAIHKVLEMGFTVYKIDVKRDFYRFRQYNPSIREYYRTKTLPNGIRLIIGYPMSKGIEI